MLGERHVVPEVGETGARMLRESVSSGTYAHFGDTPERLVEVLTTDLRLVTGDCHLFVEYLGDATMPEDDWITRWRDQGPNRNWGVSDVRLLRGNIGFVKITSFYPCDMAAPKFGAAMELIRHSTGLALDLTDNGGGDDETADAVTDTFLDAGDPRPIVIASRSGVGDVRSQRDQP